MKHLYSLGLIVVLVVFLSNCSEKQKAIDNTFEVTGEFVNDYNDSIYIDYGNHSDSVVVRDRKFSFKGVLNADNNNDREAFISLKNNAGYGVVFLDKGTINLKLEQLSTEFEGDVFNWAKVVSVTGSRNHAIWDSLVTFRNAHYKEDNFGEILLDKLKAVADTTPNSPIIGRMFYLNANNHIFPKDSVANFKRLLDTTAMFADDVANLNAIVDAARRLEKGVALKSFTLENVEGKSEEFYKPGSGKYTLIDFWASWCAPCYERNKELKKLYTTYGNVFNVIGISLDDEKQEWLEGIAEQELKWDNYVVANDWDAEICAYYGIISIPFNILVDSQGKIIEVNVTNEALEKIVSTL